MSYMRRIIGFLGCILLLAACGSDSGKFRLEGRLRNVNQAELWVYSPDGAMQGIDTITLRNGRFAYELEMTKEGTLMIVFPNYSEQPVFARPGKTVSIKGDATHLKEIIIEGTSENEDMTSLRLELNDLDTSISLAPPVTSSRSIRRHGSASTYSIVTSCRHRSQTISKRSS